MTLKDIRPDLTARLNSVRDERKVIADQLRELEAQEQSLKSLLDIENKRFHTATPEGTGTAQMPGTVFPGSLRDFADWVLQDGQALHLDEIKRSAEIHGVHVAEGVSLGRILHGALLGLKKEGLAEIVAPGTWKRVSKENAPVGLGASSQHDIFK